MSPRPPQTLLVLPLEREEFQQALADLQVGTELTRCLSLRGAAEYLRQADPPPELIVIAQARPGEFQLSEIDALVQLAPLARLVTLLGSWCEGETRTGRPWQGGTRVMWYNWPGEAERNLVGLAQQRLVSWLLPPTTTEEERWLLPTAAAMSTASTGRQIVVCTPRSSFGEALCLACQTAGYATLWLRPDRLLPVQGAAAVIWEGVQLLEPELEELRTVSAHLPGVPLIALADFPRTETMDRALAAGATSVLAKPLVVDDLLSQLAQLTGPPLQTATLRGHAA